MSVLLEFPSQKAMFLLMLKAVRDGKITYEFLDATEVALPMAGDQVSLSNCNVLHLIFCLIGRRLPWLATIFWCKYFGIFWSS